MKPRIQTEVRKWDIASVSTSILGSPPTTLDITWQYCQLLSLHKTQLVITNSNIAEESVYMARVNNSQFLMQSYQDKGEADEWVGGERGKKEGQKGREEEKVEVTG